jgi:hypothetical protein
MDRPTCSWYKELELGGLVPRVQGSQSTFRLKEGEAQMQGQLNIFLKCRSLLGSK